MQREISDDVARGARYVMDGPLRRVPPYDHTYRTFTKQRWIGRTLVDVFTTEFRDKEESYYRRKIADGLVTVNGKVATLDTVLKDGDIISHSTHKHEPPVTSRPLRLVYEDDDLVVVDKPGGVPAHPSGRFKYNSVVGILRHELGIVAHPVTRLDRLTSGLMFLAKNPRKAETLGAQIRDRAVTKEYLAMVVGVFPGGSNRSEQIVCEAPIRTVRPKLALNMVDFAEGKPSKTSFRLVSTNGHTSIVRCRPHTGRTHQIRVHLQYLGFPIANDPIYSNPRVWGPGLGKGASVQSMTVDDVEARLDLIGKTEPAASWIAAEDNTPGEVLTGENCSECDQPLYADPGPNDLGLFLHALKYASEDGAWSYETSVPEWVLYEHMPFLELALDEARKSPPLPTNFCVGACLVVRGKVVETGYTNELPGNTHAEQCVLAKYRDREGHDVPLDAVLYTTMEPCSFRLSGNLPCADRIVETPGIATVFVGVLEPTDFVAENTGRRKLEASGVQYLHLPGIEAECLRVAKRGHPDDQK